MFFGVRSYRNNVAGGTLSFGRAFTVGLLITLCRAPSTSRPGSDLLQVAPDFGDKYTAHLIEKERAAGATPEQLQATAQRMEEFKKLYQNPLVNIAFTFLEPFPIGLLVSLITAAVLRRRHGPVLGVAAGSPAR